MTPSFPHVTLIFAGALGLLVALLGINVSLARTRLKIFHEGEIPKGLHFAIRAHGNATEWVPVQLVLMLAVELAGGAQFWLSVVGGVLLTARVLHAVGLLTRLPVSPVGAVLNWVPAVWLPVWCLVLAFGTR